MNVTVSVYVCACFPPSSTKPVDKFWVRGGDLMYRHQWIMDSASCNDRLLLSLPLLFSCFSFFSLFHQKILHFCIL